MTRLLRVLFAAALVAGVFALLPMEAFSDDEDPAPAPAPEDPAPAPEDPAPEDPAPEDDPSDPDADDAPDLRKVYVPFRDLKKIFEKEGEGVFLPYEQFRALWERAHPTTPGEVGPPVAAAVREAIYEGEADGEALRIRASLQIEVLKKGWQTLPLPIAGIGVASAKIGDQPALLLPTKDGFDLVVDTPGRHTVDLVLQGAAPAKGDRHHVSFRLPPAPVSRMTLVVPGGDTEVDISPRLASTSRVRPDGKTELLAFLGPTSKLDLRWHRRPEDAPTIEPLLFAQEQHTVTVDRGVVRTTLKAQLSILRAPLDKLAIDVPGDAAVLFVNGDGLRAWRRSPDGTSLELLLREPRKETWALEIGLERPLPPPPADVALPLAFVAGMERERGFVRVDGAEGIKVEGRSAPGWIQVDPRSLPKGMRPGAKSRALAWRYPARPEPLTVHVEALEPRIHVHAGTRLGLRPEGLAFLHTSRLSVERAGIFEASWVFDGALEITDVQVSGAELDDYRTAETAEGDTRLDVSFRDRLLGGATVQVHGRRALTLPEDPGVFQEVPLPLAHLAIADHVRGYLAIHVDPALEREAKGRVGLTLLDADAAAALEPPALPNTGQAALPLVFRYEHREADTALTLAVARKKARVTAAVGTHARLDAARTRTAVTLRWHVEFSGQDTFRFKAPYQGDLESRIKLDDPTLQLLGPVDEPKPEGAAEDWKAAHGIWTVKLPAPRTGAVVVPLSIEDKDEATLASGGHRVVTLPTLVPVGVDGSPLPNTVHHVAVERDALLQVTPQRVHAAEEIDARELPATLASEEIFLAFRAYDPEHAIALDVTRHEYEDVAALVIQHMHLETQLPAQGRAQTEAHLVVRNNDQQGLALRMPEGARVRVLQVAGREQKPRKGEGGTIYIPLPTGLGKDEAFTITLAYDHDVAADEGMVFSTWSLATPEAVGEGLHTDLVTWTVHMPPDVVLTDTDGTLAPVQRHRAWAHRLLANLTGSFFVETGGRAADYRKVALRSAGPLGRVRDGHVVVRLQGREGTGHIELEGASPGAWQFVKLLWGLLAFLGVFVLMRVLSRRGRSAPAVWAAAVLLVLAAMVPASDGTAEVLAAMFWGVMVAGLVSLLVGMFARGAATVEATAEADPSAEEPAPEATSDEDDAGAEPPDATPDTADDGDDAAKGGA